VHAGFITKFSRKDVEVTKIIKLFATKDQAKVSTKNIRGLNLTAVNLTVVSSE
jgi:hypothetical protein